MLIAFEGMDGWDKSTISKKVANSLGINHETQKITRLLDIDNNKYNAFIKEIRKSNNKKLALIFYTFRCMLDKDSTCDVIVERSMISTYFYEHEKVSDKEFNYLLTLDCIPDITFILYASSDERKKRIELRDCNDEDLKSKEALSDGYKEMLDCVKNYHIPYIGINTENYNVDEIVDICTDIICKLKKINYKDRI